MKLDVSTLVFGKIQNATYVLGRSSYPRKKCGPRKKETIEGNPIHFTTGCTKYPPQGTCLPSANKASLSFLLGKPLSPVIPFFLHFSRPKQLRSIYHKCLY